MLLYILLIIWIQRYKIVERLKMVVSKNSQAAGSQEQASAFVR
jgi:hypothetical protein